MKIINQNFINSSSKDNLKKKNQKNDIQILNHSTINKTNLLTHTTLVRDKIDENYSLYNLGKIEKAKIHGLAYRPLHKLNEFNNEIKFCRCCNLPCEKKGIIEPFKLCDDIDEFSEYGLGICLYFYFFQFVIFISFFGICSIGLFICFFNYSYTEGLNIICNNDKFINNNNCSGFRTKENNKTNYYNSFNNWILRFTSDNLKVYELLSSSSKNVNKIIINYSTLNFCFLITSFIFNIFFIIFIEAQAQKVKLLNNFSIRDYTVLASNVNNALDKYLIKNKSKLKDIFDSHVYIENEADFILFINKILNSNEKLKNIKINNINMCYDLGHYLELRDKLEKCKQKILEVEYNPNQIKLNKICKKVYSDRFYFIFPFSFIGCYSFIYKAIQISKIYDQKKDLQIKLNLELNRINKITKKNFTGYMFISFNTIKEKEMILRHYSYNFMIYFFKNIKYYLCCCFLSKEDYGKFRQASSIHIAEAPEPEDIFYENFVYSSKQRLIRTILVFLISLLIIIASFAAVVGLTCLQNYLDYSVKIENFILKYCLSLIITIIISAINELFKIILEFLTNLEKQISITNFYLSLSIKITIFTFLNSAIVPLLSKHIVLQNKKYIEKNNLLLSDIIILFFYNSFITPILWVFDVKYFYKKIKIYFITKHKESQDEHHFMTQKELNKLFELSNMDVAYKYSYLTKTISLSLFYMPIFPMGIIISFFGFIFGYILELHFFSNNYKKPEILDEIIAKVYADNFVVILFIGALGDYFFFNDIFKKWSLANIILFAILFALPYSKFGNFNFIGIDKSEIINTPLSEVYLTFYTDYQRNNPLTKKIGLMNYLKKLKDKGFLSKNAFQIAQENIDKLNIMEIYYGINRKNSPFKAKVERSINKNFSFIPKKFNGKTFIKKIKESIRQMFPENEEEKVKKRKMFDSQIVNLFSSINKISNTEDDNGITIIEEEKNNNIIKEEINEDDLINAENNQHPGSLDLGCIPLSQTIRLEK